MDGDCWPLRGKLALDNFLLPARRQNIRKSQISWILQLQPFADFGIQHVGNRVITNSLALLVEFTFLCGYMKVT